MAASDVWWTYPEGGQGRPFTYPFHRLPNFVGTPHIGYATPGHRRRTMDAAVENVVRFLDGKKVKNFLPRYDYVP
jgi:phosphoglycerate dehydrogenase-like enzyme